MTRTLGMSGGMAFLLPVLLLLLLLPRRAVGSGRACLDSAICREVS